VLDLIEASGIDRVVTMDLHSPQVGGFTNLPFDHLTFEPVLVNHIRNKYHSLALRDRVVLMAPDVGAVKRIEKYATTLQTDFGFISKKRIGDDKVELQSIVGDVAGKHVVIVDDLTESCGTLIQAAKACKQNGAETVTCAVTHGAFTSTGLERLKETTSIDHLIHSNTVNNTINPCLFVGNNKQLEVTQLDVSMLFAKAVNSIHNNESISELFV
jgi:ribose-phosphate pyrophosphokinase